MNGGRRKEDIELGTCVMDLYLNKSETMSKDEIGVGTSRREAVARAWRELILKGSFRDCCV